MNFEQIDGYRVRLDVAYDAETHLWVEESPSGARIGFDPLGLEINGTLSQVVIEPVGSLATRGEPLGSLEAEKFVGPVVSPLSGTVTAVNEDVLARPSIAERQPYDSWLLELAPSQLEEERESLVSGAGAVRVWFAAQVAEYRLKGVLAE